MRYLFSQHFQYCDQQKSEVGRGEWSVVGNDGSGTVAAIGLLVAIQIQSLTFKACF